MSDSISRKGVIEQVQKQIDRCTFSGIWGEHDKVAVTCYKVVIEILKRFPSADRPEGRPTGEWIEINNGADTTCECSECHYRDYIPNVKMEQNKYECMDRYWFERKFCPNCGARMVREDGEEE